MSFTELALFIWAIAASVAATHYWGRCKLANIIIHTAFVMQLKLLNEPAYYEEMRSKYKCNMDLFMKGESA